MLCKKYVNSSNIHLDLRVLDSEAGKAILTHRGFPAGSQGEIVCADKKTAHLHLQGHRFRISRVLDSPRVLQRFQPT
jgi:hypothetical protein